MGIKKPRSSKVGVRVTVRVRVRVPTCVPINPENMQIFP